MTDHVDELAELYALGALDEVELARVRRHAATCGTCAARVSDAEDAVANLAQAQALPYRRAPEALASRLQSSIGRAAPALFFSRWGTLGAVAAAIVLTFVPTYFSLESRAPHSMTQDEQALARIADAGTRIEHAQFMATPSRAMDAKVLYGPRGDWYYVVVMHPRANMRVAYVHGGHMEMLGDVAMHGASGTLYLPVNHKMDELALIEDSRVVADAHLVYSRRARR